MANILYGAAGEGSGHASRAKEIITHLKEAGHKIKIVSYDRGFKNLSRFFEVEEIFGLNFSIKNNKIDYIATAAKNLAKFPQAAKTVKKVLDIIDNSGIQIVFSDFEPISSIASSIKNIPLICIDNQHLITKTKIEYPKKYAPQAALAKAIINLDKTVNPKNFLITSFFEAETNDPKAFVFPPILRREILKTRPKTEKYILMYMTSEFEGLNKILKTIDKQFIVYGFNQDKEEGNLIFKKASSGGFLKDLADCEGIIANAGLTLITEALYLEKPYLALPLKGQFEQILNGCYLEKLGYGKYWETLDKEKIESFLFNLDKYRENLKNYPKEDNSRIFRKIDEIILEFCKSNDY